MGSTIDTRSRSIAATDKNEYVYIEAFCVSPLLHSIKILWLAPQQQQQRQMNGAVRQKNQNYNHTQATNMVGEWHSDRANRWSKWKWIGGISMG